MSGAAGCRKSGPTGMQLESSAAAVKTAVISGKRLSHEHVHILRRLTDRAGHDGSCRGPPDQGLLASFVILAVAPCLLWQTFNAEGTVIYHSRIWDLSH